MKLNITIPVFNEEVQLEKSILELVHYMNSSLPVSYELIIADNASTDCTRAMAMDMAARHPVVKVLQLAQKGRGRAVKRAWSESAADVCCYMDVDLSTDLGALPDLVEKVSSGRCDIAIGSRLLKGSMTSRGFKREFISRCYNLLVKAVFHTQFSDAQCGFKAVSRRVVRDLLPLVEDNGWFMDTELLVLAERLGYRILDVPVRWVDDPDSRVKIFRTAIEDIRGMIRVRRNLARGVYPRKLATAPSRSSQAGSGPLAGT